jgi:hypothetical protein
MRALTLTHIQGFNDYKCMTITFFPKRKQNTKPKEDDFN